MASIQKKRIKGRLYYYAVQTARVDGKPRVVWQKYLGKAEDIVRRLEAGTTEPSFARITSFGAVAALYDLARRLELVETINRHAPKRRQGVGVGEYMLLAAVNRVLAPASKTQLAAWYERTALTHLLRVRPEQITSQRFWDHMSYLDEDCITRIEAELSARMVRDFNLDLHCLVYDTTNFVTYIDSASPGTLAKRGHSKARRGDLKQVNLALMVTLDAHIPLFHQVYPGNVTDGTQFFTITADLVRRYRAFQEHCRDVTLIYDKGNNARENQTGIDESPYHFVGSLAPSHHRDLLAIPLADYVDLKPPFAGEKALRTTKRVMGVERTVVVTYNESLFAGQIQGLSQHLTRAVRGLGELRRNLTKPRRGRKPSPATVEKRIREILSAQHMKTILKAEVDFDVQPPALNYHTDQDALHGLTSTLFGKGILFTGRDDWSNEQIVAAYRGQSQVEAAFRQMKDAHFVSWEPMFHWTDQKIRVHAFYCVLALTLSSLLQREVARQGITLSADRLLKTLDDIHEVAAVYPDSAKRKDAIVLSERNREQQQLFDLLGLGRYTIASR
ncbi:MAG: IS1634 family transposase [Bacillota bacterium]|nr:IS1634 family transposase [Bacillota bacterium]